MPGTIQPHGVMLIVDPASGRIASMAGPFEALVGYRDDPACKTLDEVIGRPLSELLTGHDLAAASEPIFVGALKGPGSAELDILAHQRDGRIVLEVEPALTDRPSASRLFATLRESIDGIRACRHTNAAAAAATKAVRAATGYSRVLIYRFLGDASGEVIGEARSGAFDTLLGHRFPAGDIPAQARALYVRNRIRVIPDANYVPLPIIGPDAMLDLSDSSLRSVSPVHLRYLHNMGVAASMSVSLLRDGQLWGLIACHHDAPRLVPYETREVCKQIASELMHRLQRIESDENAHRSAALTRGIDAFMAHVASQSDKTAALSDSVGDLQRLFDADAAAISNHGVDAASGDWPTGVKPATLTSRLHERYSSSPFATNDLEADDPTNEWRQDLDGGLLFVSTGGNEPACVILYRQRRLEKVIWAGNPDKAVQVDPVTGQLNPRKSFEIWAETQRGLPRPWMAAELSGAERFAALLDRLLRQYRIATLQAELIHVSRVSAMGALASSLAHELNQPLTAIANYSRGLNRMLTHEGSAGVASALGYLDQMSRSAIRAGQVVRRLRAMITKSPVQFEAVPVRQAIDAALTLALPDARVRGIAVSVEVQPDAEEGYGDLVQVEQVLTNLIRNASEALRGSERKRITIAAVRAGEQLELSVTDNGPGIPAATSANLFAPFNSSKETGMGLGLSISRTIVERHGGRIWVQDAAGGGASFRFTLALPRRK